MRAEFALGLGDIGELTRLDGGRHYYIELDPRDASQGSVVMIGQTAQTVEVSHVQNGNTISPTHLLVPLGCARLLTLKKPRRTEIWDTVLLRLSLGAYVRVSLACLDALKLQPRAVSRSGPPHAREQTTAVYA